MKFLITLLLTIPLACSNNSGSTLDDTYYSEDIAMPEVAVENFENTKQFAATPQKQKLIKESVMRYETQDMADAYSKLSQIISANDGFIQDDSEIKSYGRTSRQIIARLPSDNFQNAIDAITKNVDYFDTKRINSKDVTEEFIDLEARLKAKKTLENRYLELLKQAKNVKEILDIEQELSTIREEIEAKQGRLKYLQNQVALSTIHIEFYKVTSNKGVTKSYGSKMWNAVKSGFNGISIFFLGLLHIWPLILICGITFYIIKRKFFKKK
ncbi:uncharacterized protein DUF4349 [Winogradskyella wandonensis]|uniref:Uncharacterized protein DUF4349 n=1 Tax=Winogradskyella wandonensis TaxID=1442586 RepID=A0A4R1KTJ3_9FLAO|nr:DUF4349 domain-containing protein [Winogradskyella wandonensis]TCK67857.1 uncharacterized protein DUF4349 [Winogradskyella wandonensis]